LDRELVVGGSQVGLDVALVLDTRFGVGGSQVGRQDGVDFAHVVEDQAEVHDGVHVLDRGNSGHVCVGGVELKKVLEKCFSVKTW
jgi:hypothetical protein